MSYYHILVESYSVFDKKRFQSVDFDKDENYIVNNYLKPYFLLQEFYLSGRKLSKKYIEYIKIIKSEYPINVLIAKKQHEIPGGVLLIVRAIDFFEPNVKEVEDVTKELMDKVNG